MYFALEKFLRRSNLHLDQKWTTLWDRPVDGGSAHPRPSPRGGRPSERRPRIFRVWFLIFAKVANDFVHIAI